MGFVLFNEGCKLVFYRREEWVSFSVYIVEISSSNSRTLYNSI